MTEAFLILITLCAALVKKEEAAPALLYCAISYIFYFISLGVGTGLVIYKVAAISEVFLIALLLCLKGCLRSSLISFLIPVSILAIVMHFYGWLLSYNHLSPQPYNNLVIGYWCLIMGLFLSVGRWSGNYIWTTRLFRSADNKRHTV
jgi:hypothetical protein